MIYDLQVKLQTIQISCRNSLEKVFYGKFFLDKFSVTKQKQALMKRKKIVSEISTTPLTFITFTKNQLIKLRSNKKRDLGFRFLLCATMF